MKRDGASERVRARMVHLAHLAVLGSIQDCRKGNVPINISHSVSDSGLHLQNLLHVASMLITFTD